jgi:hypothetical protein
VNPGKQTLEPIEAPVKPPTTTALYKELKDATIKDLEKQGKAFDAYAASSTTLCASSRI